MQTAAIVVSVAVTLVAVALAGRAVGQIVGVIRLGQPASGRTDQFGRRTVTTLSETAPYPASDAFGIDTVPTLFRVDEDGTVRDTVVSWDRDGWNRFAEAAGGAAVSEEGDGLPPFRPG